MCFSIGNSVCITEKRSFTGLFVWLKYVGTLDFGTDNFHPTFVNLANVPLLLSSVAASVGSVLHRGNLVGVWNLLPPGVLFPYWRPWGRWAKNWFDSSELFALKLRGLKWAATSFFLTWFYVWGRVSPYIISSVTLKPSSVISILAMAR